MKVLLDTHTFLWWITDDRRLSLRAREVISNEENELFISAATGWEIAIKVRIGRLELPDDPQRFVPEQLRINAFKPLPIGMDHALHVSILPDHHRDPFDRMLIAQAQVEGMPIVSADPNIEKYQVEVIW
jgi:PIN domain nuclease of toxin-antitoxin system